MPRYRIYDYDVWGNAKDGYEVNDVFKTSYVVELSENPSDEEIIKALKKVGFLKPNFRTSSFEIEGEPGYTLYVTYNTIKMPMHYFCELRKEDE